MGCFSSKHAARSSRSLRDDFSLSLQRRTVGIPGLDDLFTSKNPLGGGDDFLALLCTANTVAMRLREREQKLRMLTEGDEDREPASYVSGDDEPMTAGSGPEDDPKPGEEVEVGENGEEVFHETINAWELLAGLEDADDKHNARHAHESEGALERGDGCGGATEVGGDSDESCVEEKRVSSTPVEDKPVDKQVISSTKILSAASVLVSAGSCPRDDDDDPVNKKVHVDNKPLVGAPTERTVSDTKPTGAGTPTSVESPALLGKGLDYSLSFRFKGSFQIDQQDDDSPPSKAARPAASGDAEAQKGVRRKALARDLKPLEVPAFEFEDIQRWIHGNEQALYDADDYETPKFGNYVRSIARARKDGAAPGDELDPDLVAALQETIDGMTAEEERILKQFVDEFLNQVQQGVGEGF